MRWVTTVTWFWVGLVLFLHTATWLLSAATCKGEAAMGCVLVGLMSLPVWVVTLLSIPFLFALWLARFVHWVSHRGDAVQHIGYVAGPQTATEVGAGASSTKLLPAPGTSALKPGDAGHRWLG